MEVVEPSKKWGGREDRDRTWQRLKSCEEQIQDWTVFSSAFRTQLAWRRLKGRKEKKRTWIVKNRSGRLLPFFVVLKFKHCSRFQGLHTVLKYSVFSTFLIFSFTFTYIYLGKLPKVLMVL